MFERPLIAIDIGSSSIKILELSEKKGNYSLRSLGLEVLPEGAIVDGVISNETAVLDAIKSLLSDLKIVALGRRASISLSGQSVIVKRVSLPFGEDLSDQISYEIEQYFNADMDEIYSDYQIMSTNPDENGMVPVLLVGAKLEVIDQYLDLVKNIGLKPGIIDCAVTCLINSFEATAGANDEVTLLAAVGHGVTQVAIIHRDQLLFNREINIGGRDYNHRIMERLGIDEINSEAMKISASIDANAIPAELEQVIKEVNNELVEEIAGSAEFFFQSGEAPLGIEKLDAIYLTGGASRTVYLLEQLANKMQLPVSIFSPFEFVNVDPNAFDMNYILTQGATYSSAVGLAVRKIDDKEQLELEYL